jgi:hypothetical protein
MKEQKQEMANTEAKVENLIQAKPEKKRVIDGDPEPGVVRIKVSGAISVKAKEVVAELKRRGAQVTLDELFGEYIEAIPARYFDDQLQKRTPEPYYLEAASKVPELRDMLIRFAKKGLMKSAVQDGTGGPRRGRRKSVKGETAQSEMMPIVAESGGFNASH